jgi:hypothetical protein
LPAAGREFRAARLSFGGQGPRFELARSAPAAWTWTKQGQVLLLSHLLPPEAGGNGRPASCEFYLGTAADAGPPSPGPLRLSRAELPCGEMLEGAARVYASGADPYSGEELRVWAEVSCPTPAGAPPKVLRAPCFFHEGPSWAPSEGEWRFRFAPSVPGLHGARLAVESGRLSATGAARGFAAAARTGGGFLRVSGGERVLRFDSGAVFIPIGLNLAWGPKKNDSAWHRAALAKLAGAGGNAARIWLCRWGLDFEPQPGRYDADAAAALDEILSAAQLHDLYLVLAVENACDLAAPDSRHAYFAGGGGPVKEAPEFFTHPEARKLFRARLAYLAARYGAFRSLMAWELLNEIDEAWPVLKVNPDDLRVPPVQADAARAARRAALAWVVEAGEQLRWRDLHSHPITLSTTFRPDAPWPELERLRAVDLLQAHGYVGGGEEGGADRDEAALLAGWAAAVRSVGRPAKPWLMAEFGYAAPADSDWAKLEAEAKQQERNERDASGLLLHNSLCAALAGGWEGAAFPWWWDRSVERHRLWGRFKGPARFAKSLAELATREGPENLRPLSNSGEPNAAVRILGRAGRSGLGAWIQDRRSTWHNALEARLPEPGEIADLELTIPALSGGEYAVTWLEPWEGKEMRRAPLKVASPGGAAAPFTLRVPPFRRDLAVLIEPEPKTP